MNEDSQHFDLSSSQTIFPCWHFSRHAVADDTFHLRQLSLVIMLGKDIGDRPDFIGQIKGFSAYEINKIKGEQYLKWQQGYGILSLSKRGLPFVKKYIQNQKKHHENNDVTEILEFVPDVGEEK